MTIKSFYQKVSRLHQIIINQNYFKPSCNSFKKVTNTNNLKMVLSPKASGEFIVKNAKFLTIKEDGIEKLTHEVITDLKTR